VRYGSGEIRVFGSGCSADKKEGGNQLLLPKFKLNLVGRPASELREFEKYYTFDMKQRSGTVLKGLPRIKKPIVYTIFVHPRHVRKLALTGDGFRKRAFFIEGEPNLDLGMDICPGDIGVACHRISEIKGKAVFGKNIKAVRKPIKEVKLIKSH